MNWNTSNIWDARDKVVISRDRSIHLVKLYASGWKVGEYEGLDIWAACSILNNMEARLSKPSCSVCGKPDASGKCLNCQQYFCGQHFLEHQTQGAGLAH